MEEVTGSVDWREPVGRQKYDWDTILSGKTYILRRGEDFTCKIKSFRTHLLGAAAKRGLSVRTRMTEGGTAVIVQAYDKKKAVRNHLNSEPKPEKSFYRARKLSGPLDKTDPHNDPLYKRVIELVKDRGTFSCSYVRQAYAIGNSRAQRIRDGLINDGIISEYDDSIPGHRYIEKKEDVAVTIPSSAETNDVSSLVIEGYEFGSNL